MIKFPFVKRFLVGLVFLFSLSAYGAEPLDINTATAKELEVVMSGVGSAKAEAIIAYRTENGDFKSIEELVNVKGIGSSILDSNREVITVKPAN
ncbi:ComEA family DNA-binding protein [Rhodanobacter aciditrophus]|uniref:ComEA family DNA-binding protein n=1 Tax=Rhodanobacter aciditrophus TaxID=1623218 RepID=A0ABW4AWL0_9GAMM